MMATKKKENKKEKKKYYDYATGKEIPDNAPVDLPEDKADEYQPEPEKPKPNKKLDKLWDDVAGKWNELDKFLTEQGLGQNARQKVVKLVNELDTIKTKILEEKE